MINMLYVSCTITSICEKEISVNLRFLQNSTYVDGYSNKMMVVFYNEGILTLKDGSKLV